MQLLEDARFVIYIRFIANDQQYNHPRRFDGAKSAGGQIDVIYRHGT